MPSSEWQKSHIFSRNKAKYVTFLYIIEDSAFTCLGRGGVFPAPLFGNLKIEKCYCAEYQKSTVFFHFLGRSVQVGTKHGQYVICLKSKVHEEFKV